MVFPFQRSASDRRTCPIFPYDEIAELFSAFKIRLVDLDEGTFLSDQQMLELGLSTETYNQRQAEKISALSDSLTRQEDIAKIKRRVRYAMVYIVEDNGSIDKIVLPVNGYGLWGIMYGFLALEGDGNTVSGIGFYDLKETPGLGYEVTNPNWTALWPGKKIYDEQGSVAMRVVKGRGQGEYEIDGLAGASLTSRGVQNLIEYWLGEDGFGPFIKNVTGI